MEAQKPSLGRIVVYVLSEQDAEQINRRRTNGKSIQERLAQQPPAWPAGAQAHIGNYASAGDEVPCLIVHVWPDEFGSGISGINGQAFLDGNDSLWVTSVKEGTEPGTWHWPARV